MHFILATALVLLADIASPGIAAADTSAAPSPLIFSEPQDRAAPSGKSLRQKARSSGVAKRVKQRRALPRARKDQLGAATTTIENSAAKTLAKNVNTATPPRQGIADQTRQLVGLALIGLAMLVGLMLIFKLWREHRRNEIFRRLIAQGGDFPEPLPKQGGERFQLNQPMRSFEGLPFSRHEARAEESMSTTNTMLPQSPHQPRKLKDEAAKDQEQRLAADAIAAMPAPSTKESRPLPSQQPMPVRTPPQGKVTVSASFSEDYQSKDKKGTGDQAKTPDVLQFAALPDTKPREEDASILEAIPDGSSSGKAS